MGVDFLPICDLLFNFVSVVTYFCDLAFDVLILKEAYDASDTGTLVPLFCAMAASLFLCQIVSLGWYLEEHRGWNHINAKDGGVILVHILQCGVLWRYTKLLIKPLALTNVKCEMRNLCILRLIHGMCQSIFFLLIQSHLVFDPTSRLARGDSNDSSLDVHYVSIAFSLFNVCWALASFNKNIRRQDVEKLVLTWIGVLFQLAWRLGTVSSRVIALTVYWSAYGWYVLFVMGLHWACMFLALVIPNKLFDSRSSKDGLQWTLKSLVVSYVYIFAYLNLESDRNYVRLRMVLYYGVTLAENLLLATLWSLETRTLLHHTKKDRTDTFLLVSLPFAGGILFMLVYYKYFHAKKLGSTMDMGMELHTKAVETKLPARAESDHPSHHPHAVFNCVLPAGAKKKKMPSILPPPPVMPREAAATAVASTDHLGRAKVPFWKEPLPLQQQQSLPVTTNPASSNGGSHVYANSTADDYPRTVRYQRQGQKRVETVL